MTKYILAGGNDLISDGYGERLAAEVYKENKSSLRILSCFFSSPEESWDKRAKEWEQWFKKYFGDNVEYDFVKVGSFEAQVANADVIYLHGGDNKSLMESLEKISDIPGIFGGKVVVGSSAGANYLSTAYWTRTGSKAGHGAAILSVGVLVHYLTTDQKFGNIPADYWTKAEAKLKELLPAACPIVKLREGEFTVFEL